MRASTCLAAASAALLLVAGCTRDPCGLGSVECDGACVRLTTDAAHCGACGNACGPGQVCSAGACAATCAAPFATCGEGAAAGCALLAGDPANCGACGRACAAGQLCAAGACVPGCDAPLAICGEGAAAACVALQDDPAHCGACGHACAGGEACHAGRCELTCAGGAAARCGDRCVDLATSNTDCGACGAACAPGTACAAGHCEPTCPAGQARCGDACVTLATDVLHCGACGIACQPGTACEAGACVALACAGDTGLPGQPDMLSIPRDGNAALADLDGDGRIDVVTVDRDRHEILALLNLGERRFAAPIRTPLGLTGAFGWLVADLTGDGKPDLLALPSNGIQVFPGLGNGRFDGGFFGHEQQYAWGPATLADLDGDGRLDLIHAPFTLAVRKGFGAGFGDPVLVGAKGGPYLPWGMPYFDVVAVAEADLDGDGHPDVVGVNRDGAVGVYLNDGAGALADPVTYAVAGEVYDVSIGDVDGDGRPDVVVPILYGFGGQLDGLAVLRNLGGGALAEPVYLSSQQFVYTAAAIDVDGDGRAEPIAVSWDGRHLDVFDRAEDGSFGPARAYFDEGAWAVLGGDLDGDGRVDLAIPSNPPAAVHLLWGEGGGRFGYPAGVPAGPVMAQPLVTADLDGDGRPDVVAGGYDWTGHQGWLGWLPAVPGGLGAARTLATDLRPLAAVAGDLDEDGRTDLVLLADAPAIGPVRLIALRADGAGGFAEAELALFPDSVPAPYGTFLHAGGLAIVDLDGDGHLDLVVSAAVASVEGYYRLRGHGDGTFDQPVLLCRSDFPDGLALADLDGDGRLDAVVTDYEQLVVLLGAGDGTFAEAARFSEPGHVFGIAVGDLDGDGKPDLGAVESFVDQVVILRNLGGGAFARSGSVEYPSPDYYPRGFAFAPLRQAGGRGAILVTGAYGADVGLVDLVAGQPRLRRFATRGVTHGALPLDLDGDLRPEVVAGGNGELTILRSACLP